MEESAVVSGKNASVAVLAAGMMLCVTAGPGMAFYEESLESASGEVRPVEILDSATPGQKPSALGERDLPQAASGPISPELAGYMPPPVKDAPADEKVGSPIQKAPETGVRPVRATHKKPGVTREIGKKESTRVVKVTARGAGVPLSAALSIVMPKGWKADLGASGKKKVSFSAKAMPWTRVVDSLAKKAGAPVVIDWRKASVRLDRSGGETIRVAAAPAAGKVKGGIVKKAVIDRPGRADEVASRYGVPVGPFCSWNNFGPATPLPAGYEVYLEEPPAGTQVVANMPTWEPSAPEPQVSPTTVAAQKPESAATQEAVQPAAKPLEAKPEKSPAPAAVPAVQPVAPPVAADAYQYALGPGPLSAQLSQWCAHGGYQLVWKVDEEFEITTHSAYGTDFHKSLETLFNDLKLSGFPLRGTVYERNHMVEVTGE